jgi:hypothetical protein
MSVRRTFHCDGPECAAHVETAAEHPPTFVTVLEEPGYAHEQRPEHHFCSWDCVLKYAAMIEPSEIIPADGGSDA